VLFLRYITSFETVDIVSEENGNSLEKEKRGKKSDRENEETPYIFIHSKFGISQQENGFGTYDRANVKNLRASLSLSWVYRFCDKKSNPN